MARRAISPRVSGGHLGGVSLAAGHGAGVRPADVYIPLRNAHCRAGGAHRRAGRAGEPRLSRRDGFPVSRSERGALSGFRRRFAHSAGKLRRSILPRERRFRRLRGRQPLENRQRHDRAHARAGTAAADRRAAGRLPPRAGQRRATLLSTGAGRRVALRLRRVESAGQRLLPHLRRVAFAAAGARRHGLFPPHRAGAARRHRGGAHARGAGSRPSKAAQAEAHANRHSRVRRFSGSAGRVRLPSADADHSEVALQRGAETVRIRAGAEQRESLRAGV